MPVDSAHLKVGFQELVSRASDAHTRINYDDILLAHKSQEMVRVNLHALEYYSSGDEDLQQSIAKASRNFNEMSKLLDRIWNIVPPSVHTSTRSSMKAQEAFGITELLERILVHLEAPEILRSMLVQRCWYDTIVGSVELKKVLGLLPLDRDVFYTAFDTETLWNSNGRVVPKDLFRADITDPQDRYNQRMALRREISRDFSTTTGYMGMMIVMCGKYARPPYLGSRIASMLICHPPVKQLQVDVRCRYCKRGDEDSNAPRMPTVFEISSRSEIGFTMGEIVDKTHHLRAVHKNCAPRFGNYDFPISPSGINYTAITSIPWKPPPPPPVDESEEE